MTKEEIIHEWLSIGANRNRLTIFQVSEFERNVYNSICTIHIFDTSESGKVYELPNGELVILVVK